MCHPVIYWFKKSPIKSPSAPTTMPLKRAREGRTLDALESDIKRARLAVMDLERERRRHPEYLKGCVPVEAWGLLDARRLTRFEMPDVIGHTLLFILDKRVFKFDAVCDVGGEWVVSTAMRPPALLGAETQADALARLWVAAREENTADAWARALCVSVAADWGIKREELAAEL